MEIGERNGWEVKFWNQTPFDLSSLGFQEIKLSGKPRPLTDLYKRAKINSELDYFTEKFRDPVYQSYKFPPSGKGWKNVVKRIMVKILERLYAGKEGVLKIQKKLKQSEKETDYYKRSLEVLKKEKPHVVLCTNQRAVNAIAPLLAAENLKIYTVCFIFSWDNLPKATLVINTDYYLVWSEYMKRELLQYYPFINSQQIKVTGSPQFEHYFDKELLVSKEDFYLQNGLDSEKEYLCFSGDDITTSPHDHLYLNDVAEAVRDLNSRGRKLGVIFRRSPVDFSPRYDEVINSYPEIITPIAPKWEKKGERWNTILPTKEDLFLQANLLQNTFMVINVGSSMIFDYVCMTKPGAYINYNPQVENLEKNINEIYEYVHFRSMPSEKSVLWINNKDEIREIIQKVLEGNSRENVEAADKWFNIINRGPAKDVSKNIWKELSQIK